MQRLTGICIPALALLIASTTTGCASAGRSAAWERPPEEVERPAPAATSQPGEVDALLAMAEQKWRKRDDKAAVLEAIRLWENVVEREPKHTPALTRLSRAYYFLVDAHLNNEEPLPPDIEEQRLELHQKGADAGELALVYLEPEFERTMRESGDFVEAMGKIRPDSVESAYWYCTNLGRFSIAKGLAAKLFYKDRISGAMHRIRELDAPFFYGAADRYLGAFYAALPGIAGKDLDRSEQHFRAAQALGPRYLGNYLIEAEFLAVERGERERYVELLQRVLAAPVGEDPDMAPENAAAKRTAQRLLAPQEIDDRF